MASRPKKVKARKVASVTQEQPKSQARHDNAEKLIIQNGNSIEGLLGHDGWQIVEELIDEGIASVTGRKTNGYYYKGTLSTSSKDKDYLVGYQDGLTELYNRVKDFIKFRDKLIQSKKREKSEVNEPMINPFMEE